MDDNIDFDQLIQQKIIDFDLDQAYTGTAPYIIEGGHMKLVNGISGIYARLLTHWWVPHPTPYIIEGGHMELVNGVSGIYARSLTYLWVPQCVGSACV